MAIIVVLRKMLKNRWLTFCLLLGIMIATALVSSIPVYSSGVLQRLLIKEMEQHQLESGSYPGSCTLSLNFESQTSSTERYSAFIDMANYAKTQLPVKLGIPYHLFIVDIETDLFSLTPEDPTIVDPSPDRTAKLKAVSDFEDHIQLTSGRMASNESIDGIYEALVTEGALNELKMVLGNVFVMRIFVGREAWDVKIKPVGTFIPKQTNDYFWTKSSILYDKRFYIHKDLFMKDLVQADKCLIKSSEWYFALDYHKIMVHDISRLLSTYDAIERTLREGLGRKNLSIPVMRSLEKYLEQEQQMKLLLLSLNVPILLMLSFYLFMVSSLIVEADRNEIAIYQSRGASRWQILIQYFTQGFVLGAISLLAGPYLGLLCTKMLGAPKEFMQFYDRTALPVAISKDAFIYGLFGIFVFMIMILIPAFKASKLTIITHKRKLSRNKEKQIWEKFYLDVVLLSIALYGIYSFRLHRQILEITRVNAVDLQVSPLLFIASTFFVLGIGLMFMRIYPWILSGIYYLLRRSLSLSLYESLLRVSRSFCQYQFIIVFLMMTLATGIFSANVARTINNNMDHRILYHIGSDVVVFPLWQYQMINPTTGAVFHGAGNVEVDEANSVQMPLQVQYIEPPYQRFAQLPEVINTAKVFNRESVFVQGPAFSTDNVRFMAIDSYDFGQVAWFRNDLLAPYHINEYLNLLTLEPGAILISQALSEYYRIQVGDTLHVGWPGVNRERFTVYGVIHYWPSWNPLQGERLGGMSDMGSMFIVANLSYVQDYLALEPYEIWMQIKPGATSADLYQSMEERDLRVIEMRDAKQEIVRVRSGPGNIGINGATTLGFITSLVITFLGFLIYWVLAIRKRMLEFGIFRAIGVSLFKVIHMIVWEQVLVSIVAALAGVLVGNFASRLFVPFFSIAYSADITVPPFKVFSEYSDHLKLYGFFAVMLITVFAILTAILMRIKIIQVIKLGED